MVPRIVCFPTVNSPGQSTESIPHFLPFPVATTLMTVFSTRHPIFQDIWFSEHYITVSKRVIYKLNITTDH